MATKPGVTMTKDGFGKMLAALRRIPKRDVLVGIPDSDSERGSHQGSAVRRESGGVAQDVTNPTLGFVHEFGAPELNIPARPHLMPGIRAAKPKIAKYLGQAANALLSGKPDVADRALHAAGIAAMSSVQGMIRAGLEPPLSPRTVAARRIRATGSKYRRKAKTAAETTPLIDTGQYLRAITYVVRDADDSGTGTI